MTTSQPAPQAVKRDAWERLGHALPDPGPVASDVIWQALASYFSWFARGATRNRIAYQTLKVLSLLLAAAVTVLAATGAPAALTACIGAAIVVGEGVQQLFKFHTNWLRYRVVTETLREHALLFVAHLAPYDDDDTAREKLARLIRTVIEGERKQWSVQMRPADADTP